MRNPPLQRRATGAPPVATKRIPARRTGSAACARMAARARRRRRAAP